MPNKKQTRSSAGFLVVALICAGAVFAVAEYVRAGHQFLPKSQPEVTVERAAPEQPLRTHRNHPGSSDLTPSGRQEAGPFVFTPSMVGSKIVFTRTAAQVPDDEDARAYVVNRFLENSRVVGPNAHLMSLEVRDGIAYLYFNQEMNQTFGTDDESTLLNGILTTLGQFPEINSALFYSEGKRIDSFGNVDLTTPQTVIRDASSDSTTRSEEPKSSVSR